MGLFDSSPTKQTQTTTPSLAAQGAARARARMLMAVLQASAGRGKPSFAQWRGGAPMPNAIPGGLEVGIPELLALMNRPGAFDTKTTVRQSGGGPSLFSDLLQLAMTAAIGGGPMGAGLWGAGKRGGATSYPMILPTGEQISGWQLGEGQLAGGGESSGGTFDSVLNGLKSAGSILSMLMMLGA